MSASVDGVRLAVLANRVQAIVRSMMNTLVRTGRSGVLNTARDFSCCALTAGHELVAMAESLPIHIVRGPDLMSRVMTELHPELRRGDAYLNNSPYHGNSHAADHSILVPVFDGGGVHRFTVLAKAHQADCGNALPTTYSATARDVYEEGAIVFPCVKVQQAYADVEDIVRMCRQRIRVPDQWWGDYLALLGAARVGERKLVELGEEVGWDALAEHTSAWFDYSERRMDAELRRLPRGRLEVRTAHDPFPGVPDGIPLKVGVVLQPDAGAIEIDLRDNPDCQPCGLNLTEATAYGAAMVGVFNSIDHTVPSNEGSFRRIRVLLRENCVAGIPRFPASCSVGTTNVVDRVANAVQRGIAELAEGKGMAEIGLSFPASSAVVSGRDPRTGEPFVNQLILAWTGGAGGPDADGWLNQSGVGDGGALLRDSIELNEMRFPVRFHEQRIVPDTEGAGRRRGAPSARLEYGPIGCTMEVMYTSDGSVHPALGARGGAPGAPAQQFVRGRDGALVPADPCGHLKLEDGETVVSLSCGGGGYGPAPERPPELVAQDVREGWISPGRALEAYGVVLDADGSVDLRATARRRDDEEARWDSSTDG
ncbi:MAG: N-methylhydantoinase [Thermoleophilaceae bacterium]|nr:N-methylhydantoinase [Thermoleophilaceae bacterium]